MRLREQVEDFDEFGLVARCSEQGRVASQRHGVTADKDDRCRRCSDQRVYARLAKPRARRVCNDEVDLGALGRNPVSDLASNHVHVAPGQIVLGVKTG